MSIHYSILACFVILTSQLYAQDAPLPVSTDSVLTSQGFTDLIYEDFTVAVDDGLGYFSAPLSYDTEDWVYFGATVGGTLLLITQDEALRRTTYRNMHISPDARSLLDIGLHSGDLLTGWIVSSALYFPGLISDAWLDGEPFGKGKIRTAGRLLGESLFLSGVLAVVMRAVLGRDRPEYLQPDINDPWDFDWFNLDAEDNSFPSGHLIVTYSIATTLAEHYDNWILRGLLYSVAGVATYERFLSDQHWGSDLFLGAAIGISTGLYAVKRERERQTKPTNSPAPVKKLSFYPTGNGIGLTIHF